MLPGVPSTDESFRTSVFTSPKGEVTGHRPGTGPRIRCNHEGHRRETSGAGHVTEKPRQPPLGLPCAHAQSPRARPFTQRAPRARARSTGTFARGPRGRRRRPGSAPAPGAASRREGRDRAGAPGAPAPEHKQELGRDEAAVDPGAARGGERGGEQSPPPGLSAARRALGRARVPPQRSAGPGAGRPSRPAMNLASQSGEAGAGQLLFANFNQDNT